MTLGVRKMKLLGVAAVALLALSAGGCSSLPTVPDWVDPTTWFSGDEPSEDPGETPDLASLPGKPAVATPDEQHDVAKSLAADRANAKYSADALRGGTEPAATPPADVAPQQAANNDAEIAAPKAAPKAAPAPVHAAVDRSLAQDPGGSTAAGTLPPPPAGMPSGVTMAQAAPVEAAPAAVEPVKPVKSAKKTKKAKSVEMAATPAVEPAPAPVAVAPKPVAPASVMTASISPSDAELGFKPSSAPALDPSVSQFVEAPILSRYNQTAANAGMAYGEPVAKPRARKHRSAAPSGVAMGGPAKMEGKVVANLDALGGPAQPAVVANLTGEAMVVYFPGDSVGLNGEGRALVRAAVAQFKAAGGQGYVRVVGHSSSRTPNMTAEQHLQVIFKKSQDRANAVARALIQSGVPADRVLVEAVGDSQPVYYESMPKGEEGNRRAEIFVQG